MIKIENEEVVGWEASIRGLRNPKNSWEKSDSGWSTDWIHTKDRIFVESDSEGYYELSIGPNDQKLMKSLVNAGTDHRKFMRMITVYLDITAPLYWWKEMDQYRVGQTTNSCSTMHKIHAKEFTIDDFSHDNLNEKSLYMLNDTIRYLNGVREAFLETKDKGYWYSMIQLLPSSYNQRRTVMLNYEVLANIYKSRKNHKLDEWRDFCKWIETLPYAELITGKDD